MLEVQFTAELAKCMDNRMDVDQTREDVTMATIVVTGNTARWG